MNYTLTARPAAAADAPGVRVHGRDIMYII